MKTIKMAVCFGAMMGCIAISVIGFIGMLCHYQTVKALPWAFASGVFFIGAMMFGIKMGDCKNAE